MTIVSFEREEELARTALAFQDAFFGFYSLALQLADPAKTGTNAADEILPNRVRICRQPVMSKLGITRDLDELCRTQAREVTRYEWLWEIKQLVDVTHT